MRKIHRYTLGTGYHNAVYNVEMPKGAKIISCQWHDIDDSISIWAIVNAKHSMKEHEFHIFGTGFEMDDYDKKHYEFIATVQEKKGLVWHVFEVFK